MRKRFMLSTVSLTLVAAGTGVALATDMHPKGSAATTVTTSPSTTTMPTSPSPQPSHTATPAHAAAPTLSLNLPTAFAAGTATQFGFTAANPGAAQTVTVTLDLGTPTAATPQATEPNERAVLERQDPATGSWIPLPVTFSSGARLDTATYQLNLPTRASATERLRLTPVGVKNTTIAVSLSGSAFMTVSQSSTVPLVAPSLTGSGPSSAAPGTTQEFDFTLTNQTSGNYTGVQLYLMAYGSTAGCGYSPFTTAQWSDGGAWKATSISGTISPLLGTVSLAAGESEVLRVKLAVPAALPSCLAKGQVAVIAETQGAQAVIQNSQTGSTTQPSFSARGDSPFFSISGAGGR